MKAELRNSTRRSISSRHRGGDKSKEDRPRVEVSSGGLVFKRTRQGIYFAMLKDSFGKWTFPKGHVRRGETYDAAAAREVNEELGLESLRKKESLGHIDIWFRDRYVFKGKLIHKYIHYFLFEAHPRARLRRPVSKAQGEKIQAVAWVPAGDVTTRSTYKDMKPIIKRAFAVLPKNRYTP